MECPSTDNDLSQALLHMPLPMPSMVQPQARARGQGLDAEGYEQGVQPPTLRSVIEGEVQPRQGSKFKLSDLEAVFQQTPYLDSNLDTEAAVTMTYLTTHCGLQQLPIRTWFQTRRREYKYNQLEGKKQDKPPWHFFTPDQTQILERELKAYPNFGVKLRRKIAKQLGVIEPAIRMWFELKRFTLDVQSGKRSIATRSPSPDIETLPEPPHAEGDVNVMKQMYSQSNLPQPPVQPQVLHEQPQVLVRVPQHLQTAIQQAAIPVQVQPDLQLQPVEQQHPQQQQVFHQTTQQQAQTLPALHQQFGGGLPLGVQALPPETHAPMSEVTQPQALSPQAVFPQQVVHSTGFENSVCAAVTHHHPTNNTQQVTPTVNARVPAMIQGRTYLHPQASMCVGSLTGPAQHQLKNQTVLSQQVLASQHPLSDAENAFFSGNSTAAAESVYIPEHIATSSVNVAEAAPLPASLLPVALPEKPTVVMENVYDGAISQFRSQPEPTTATSTPPDDSVMVSDSDKSTENQPLQRQKLRKRRRRKGRMTLSKSSIKRQRKTSPKVSKPDISKSPQQKVGDKTRRTSGGSSGLGARKAASSSQPLPTGVTRRHHIVKKKQVLRVSSPLSDPEAGSTYEPPPCTQSMTLVEPLSDSGNGTPMRRRRLEKRRYTQNNSRGGDTDEETSCVSSDETSTDCDDDSDADYLPGKDLKHATVAEARKGHKSCASDASRLPTERSHKQTRHSSSESGGGSSGRAANKTNVVVLVPEGVASQLTESQLLKLVKDQTGQKENIQLVQDQLMLPVQLPPSPSVGQSNADSAATSNHSSTSMSSEATVVESESKGDPNQDEGLKAAADTTNKTHRKLRQQQLPVTSKGPETPVSRLRKSKHKQLLQKSPTGTKRPKRACAKPVTISIDLTDEPEVVPEALPAPAKARAAGSSVVPLPLDPDPMSSERIRATESQNASSEPRLCSLEFSPPGWSKKLCIKAVYKTLDEIQVYQCPLCAHLSTAWPDVTSHFWEAHRNLLHICEITLGDEAFVELYMFCRLCDYIAVEKSALWEHFLRFHCEDVHTQCCSDDSCLAAIKRYICPACAFVCDVRLQIVNHIQFLHDDLVHKKIAHLKLEVEPAVASNNSVDALFQERKECHVCLECLHASYSAQAARRHFRQCHVSHGLLFVCNHCLKWSMRQETVTAHLETEHNITAESERCCSATMLWRQQEVGLLSKGWSAEKNGNRKRQKASTSPGSYGRESDKESIIILDSDDDVSAIPSKDMQLEASQESSPGCPLPNSDSAKARQVKTVVVTSDPGRPGDADLLVIDDNNDEDDDGEQNEECKGTTGGTPQTETGSECSATSNLTSSKGLCDAISEAMAQGEKAREVLDATPIQMAPLLDSPSQSPNASDATDGQNSGRSNEEWAVRDSAGNMVGFNPTNETKQGVNPAAEQSQSLSLQHCADDTTREASKVAEEGAGSHRALQQNSVAHHMQEAQRVTRLPTETADDAAEPVLPTGQPQTSPLMCSEQPEAESPLTPAEPSVVSITAVPHDGPGCSEPVLMGDPLKRNTPFYNLEPPLFSKDGDAIVMDDGAESMKGELQPLSSPADSNDSNCSGKTVRYFYDAPMREKPRHISFADAFQHFVAPSSHADAEVDGKDLKQGTAPGRVRRIEKQDSFSGAFQRFLSK